MKSSGAIFTSPERQRAGFLPASRTGTPVGPPTSPPVVKVETVSRLRHVIQFTDAATSTKKAKPPGVTGAEIWVKLAAVANLPTTTRTSTSSLKAVAMPPAATRCGDAGYRFALRMAAARFSSFSARPPAWLLEAVRRSFPG